MDPWNQDNVSDIRCKEANKCNEPPYPSDVLTHDFDNYKINENDTFSYYCPTKEKSKKFRHVFICVDD